MAETLLRFLTCGSVDDGKSTLIGRLLLDAGLVPDDQRAEGEADPSRLVDGLAAEREQGITIDVAYRYFATGARKFIVADCPGHEQYTRNMVTGASTADAAVILIDARKGVLTQTRRHAFLCKLLGVRHFILAVNKMDLVGYDEATFAEIVAEAAGLDLPDLTVIPLSARAGDNVVRRLETMDWYRGRTLFEALHALEPTVSSEGRFRLPVQAVVRPDQDFRGFAGTLVGGSVRPGEAVRILPSGRTGTVARLVTFDGDLSEAAPGTALTVTLAEDIDCGRGDVIVAAHDAPQVADQFEATLVWFDEEAMLPGRAYLLKLATQTVGAQVTDLRHRIDVNTHGELAAKTLAMNDIGEVHLSTDRPLVFEPYDTSRELGGFILIDRVSGATAGAGMLRFALRRAGNLHRQATTIDRDARARLKGQRPAVVWLTGLSGAGKSTIADLVERRLAAGGRHTILLDGDNVRHGLNRDLGFTAADRVENIRRIGEVARLMTDAGLIVLCAFISPFRAERELVRRMLPEGEFLEVFVDTSLAEAERRDRKGLYAKARAGELTNFTGIDSPYEEPETPVLRLDTSIMSAEQAADAVIALLDR